MCFFFDNLYFSGLFFRHKIADWYARSLFLPYHFKAFSFVQAEHAPFNVHLNAK